VLGTYEKNHHDLSEWLLLPALFSHETDHANSVGDPMDFGDMPALPDENGYVSIRLFHL
jgi:hypothetical protein